MMQWFVSGRIIQRLYTDRPSGSETRREAGASLNSAVWQSGRRPSPRLRSRRRLGHARRVIGPAAHVVETRLLGDHGQGVWEREEGARRLRGELAG